MRLRDVAESWRSPGGDKSVVGPENGLVGAHGALAHHGGDHRHLGDQVGSVNDYKRVTQYADEANHRRRHTNG
jgi:hypothetical protein